LSPEIWGRAASVRRTDAAKFVRACAIQAPCELPAPSATDSAASSPLARCPLRTCRRCAQSDDRTGYRVSASCFQMPARRRLAAKMVEEGLAVVAVAHDPVHGVGRDICDQPANLAAAAGQRSVLVHFLLQGAAATCLRRDLLIGYCVLVVGSAPTSICVVTEEASPTRVDAGEVSGIVLGTELRDTSCWQVPMRICGWSRLGSDAGKVVLLGEVLKLLWRGPTPPLRVT
jgi:hypothetical protein